MVGRRTFILSVFALGLSPSSGAAQDASTLDLGLIFVGAGWCTLCHLAAPLVQRVAALENIPVLVASHDGRPIPPFDHVQPSQGHPIADQINAFPAVLIYAPSEDAIVARLDGISNPKRYLARLTAILNELREAGYGR